MKKLLISLFLLSTLLGTAPHAASQEILPELTQPAAAEHQPTALEQLDASLPAAPPVRIIHEGQTTSDGTTLPPIIEERIPPSPDPDPQKPSGSQQIPALQQPDMPPPATAPENSQK